MSWYGLTYLLAVCILILISLYRLPVLISQQPSIQKKDTLKDSPQKQVDLYPTLQKHAALKPAMQVKDFTKPYCQESYTHKAFASRFASYNLSVNKVSLQKLSTLTLLLHARQLLSGNERLGLAVLLVWTCIFTLCGGRLGYVLFYEPDFYFSYLSEVIKLYKGGMSFHGAVIGCICGVYFLTKRAFWTENFSREQLRWWLFDSLCLTALIVLPIGRLCNFFNGEAFGRVTDVPWSVIFANVDLQPRHPSQLYEAIAEGPILASLLWLWMCLRNKLLPSLSLGRLSVGFLIGYGILRFGIEFTREADISVGYFYLLNQCKLTLGQLLCLLQIIVGVLIGFYMMRTRIVMSA